MTPDLLLGLIGDNIAASRSPLLHVLAGRQNGKRVQYDRLVPAALGLDFAAVFAGAAAQGYRGLNITYPYKEKVVAHVTVADPQVRAVGAVNTVLFGPDGPMGHNTDYSGFIAAYRGLRGDAPTGAVLMIGTGGVGRAVAFGLVALGVQDLRLVDRDRAKASALAADLQRAAPQLSVQIADCAETAASGAQGVVNCTPVGMVGYGGTPLARSALAGTQWVFDAVYTPAQTQFLTDARAQGAQVLSGWELFFWQGVQAWALFSDGLGLDLARLRADLLAPSEDAV
ncbi:shikimate dehydrogenase [Roseinatronobacter sp. S2]|uniref:shikimate dehydrogenase family protein n=1 Tax=Roseinatronobacter sp. S2 TaxID=3035471 RepID=UPI00240FFBC4|nr:shikimate dehydrogenase [Roseinatronobacter sp. S2]WFE76169.1 shikimate dehydrogenase [Roseinatronobacter sp. S2]